MVMETKGLGRKQTLDQAAWLAVKRTIAQRVSRPALDALVSRTLSDIAQTLKHHKRVAYCWSGGKDSLVLEAIMTRAGIGECVMGMCNLEYPAFLQWVTDHMPWGLEIIDTGQDLAWLARHPDMLFPQDAKTAAKWFKQVQHTAQARYYERHNLDCIILGRRKSDGNYTGPAGANIYTNREGVTRYSPMRDWTHEDIFAYIHYYNLALPPIYDWPNGYRVGTGAWAARQYTGSTMQGWREVYSIDPSVVTDAARLLPSAQRFLASLAGNAGNGGV